MKLEPQKRIKNGFKLPAWVGDFWAWGVSILPNKFRYPSSEASRHTRTQEEKGISNVTSKILTFIPSLKMPTLVKKLGSGLFSTTLSKSTSRLKIVMLGFAGLYLLLGGRLIQLGLNPDEPTPFRKTVADTLGVARPSVVDRNGELMAADVKLYSVYVEPKKLIDLDDAVELINGVFPDIDHKELRRKFAKRSGFVWIKREISPSQMAQVNSLGLPGLGFLPEYKRVYPNGSVASHVVGFTDKDNKGIAGIEKFIDTSGLNDLNGLGFGAVRSTDLKPVDLSIDMRVTHAMRDELQKGMVRYKAKAAAGVILNVNTGEIVAHVSLPDYDPNTPVDALDNNHIDRMSVGRYEMGSTFKALTTAMALDSGKVNMNSTFDARNALTYGRFRIRDSHNMGRALNVPEIFMHSSNIGTARMALSVGVEAHKAFLKKLGQLDTMRTELPEAAAPIVPKHWGELNTMTISFGHGLAVTPLQASVAVAALVNGGIFLNPTVLKRSEEEAAKLGRRVIKPETSENLRYVLRLNAERGTATRANIPGYFVGAKTGTAEKVVGGRYSKTKVLTTFMAIAPADKPKYLFTIILDEPQGTPETHNFVTSGWNSAPVAGNIIERVGPMLDMTPRFDPPVQPFPYVARLNLKVPQ
jgi:cell division protein FtsI (penicillin-binding protein 3)